MLTDPDRYVSFGYVVRRRRKTLDLTQHALADLIGCSLVTVKKIETDQRQPSHQMAERFADVLHIPPEERAAFLALARRPLSITPLSDALLTGVPVAPAPAYLNATPFLGREVELQEIAAYFRDPICRLLTLVGPGGIGKTKLASHLVTWSSFADGVYVISLVDITASMLIASTIARGLEVHAGTGDDPQQAIIHFLKQRALLLVLDNVEQLLQDEAIGPNVLLTLLSRILRDCPQVKILVTSRERLNMQAEWVYPIKGLPVETDAVRLFVACAQRRDPSFSRAGQEAHIKAICALVEGMPLAIELAAGWIPTLSCEQIHQHLQIDMELLTTRIRDLPARHRSLRALFDHLWQGWTQDEQAQIMKLSVFRGGFTLERCTALTGIGLDLLRTLVDTSVISIDQRGRYRLHELTRRYLADQLAASGAESVTRHEHFSLYLALAETAASHLAGSTALFWLSQLDEECDNLRAALDWALVSSDALMLYHLALPLVRYWYARGLWQEGTTRLQAILTQTPNAVAPERALCLCWCAIMQIRNGQPEMARKHITEGAVLAQQTQNEQALGLASLAAGYFNREGDKPVRSCQAAIDHFRSSHDDEDCAMALYFLGDEWRMRGETTAAQQAYSESWQIYHSLGNRIYGAYPLGNLGRIALLQGDLAQAEQRFMECVAYSRENGNHISLCDWLVCLGLVALNREDFIAARVALNEANELARKMAYQDGLSTAQVWLALLESLNGTQDQALDYLRKSLDWYNQKYHVEAITPSHLLLPHHQLELLNALIVYAHMLVCGRSCNQAIIILGCVSGLMDRYEFRIDQPLAALKQRLLRTCQEEMEATGYNEHWKLGIAKSTEPLQLLKECLHGQAINGTSPVL